MKIFLKYLKMRSPLYALAILLAAILTASFYLYSLPVAALIYPFLLCFFASLIISAFDFPKVYKKHRDLTRIKGFIELSDKLYDELYDKRDIIEGDYREIISRLCDEHNRFVEDTAKEISDTADYYSVWVHQIKTPIASMKLQLQNEDSALARKLSSDLFRTSQYVDMVMTFIRLRSDSTDYVIKEYKLDPIIKQAVKNFSSEFIDRNIRLIYTPCDICVVTDEKWLSFVIEQLLSNALKYTQEGSITIDAGHDQNLRITDTGIGIEPSDLPRIFENGFTGFNGRRDKKASGIGLYLCKRICTNLGHGISASSVPGKGTTVTLDLSQRKLEVE